MDKRTITISVDKDITQEEINEIRRRFKESKYYTSYRLNIIISGNDDIKENLSAFLISRLKS